MDWVLIKKWEELSQVRILERQAFGPGLAIGVCVTRATLENGLKQIGDPVRRVIHLIEVMGHFRSQLGWECCLDGLLEPQGVFTFNQHVEMKLPAKDFVVLEVERNVDANEGEPVT